MRLFDKLEKSLLWYSLVFNLYAEEINRFLSLHSSFEHAFLLGEYAKCVSLLDCCHEQFGWSIWEIKNRIALLSEQSGNDEQKKYTSEIIEKLKSHRILPYLISRFSKLCERNNSFNAYLNTVQSDYNRFLSNGSSPLVCQYALYKTNGVTPSDRARLNHLNQKTLNYFLCEDDKCSLIDRYLSFCNLVADVFNIGDVELQALFVPYLRSLSTKIEDSFLKNAVYFQAKHYDRFCPRDCEQICQAFDFYSKGNYQESLSLATQLLRNDIECFPIAELYVKSSIYLPAYPTFKNGDCLLDTILYKLRKLFVRQGDIIELQTDLFKILLTNWDAAWSRQLLLMVGHCSSRFTFSASTTLRNLHSAISLPSIISHLDSRFLTEYLNTTSPTFRSSLSVRLAISVREKDINLLDSLPIDSNRKEKYKARLLIDAAPIRATKILNELRLRPEIEPILSEIDAMRVRAALNAGNFLQAMNIFITAFYQNANFVYIGHIDRIFQAIKSEDHDVRTSILPSILCSIYFNYYPSCDECDDIIWVLCYEEYLTSKEVQKPSELLCLLTAETDTNLLRFLSDVCVPSIMERSIVFESSGDVLQERITICRKLVDVYPDFRDRYEAEIQRLSKTSLIQLARQKVECGKIHIDLESIRTLLTKDVSEPYEQYINFKDNEFNNRILRILSTESSNTPVIVFPRITQSDMFRDVVQHARNIFVADSKYGLDGCLSVRIRHGTLESQLRSCFEKYHLVTKKMAGGSYNKNSYWISKNQSTFKDAEVINDIFSNFSTRVDEIITRLKKELIQIKTEIKGENGLFDFTISPNQLAALESKVCFGTSYTSFEDFLDMILTLLLDFTESALKKVRNVLQTEIDSNFQQALKDLETELQKCKGKGFDFHGLSDQIANARTDISAELKNISEWFHLDQPDSYPDFTPSVALSISNGKVQPFHPSLELLCDSQNIDDSITLKGWTLPNFVDIFIILLDNVVRHSGFVNKVTVKISVLREGNLIKIRAENPVKSGGVDPNHLRKIESQLNDWENQNFVSKEGGSGLHKLKRVLSADLGCKNTVSIFGKDDTFEILIEAELSEVLL